MCRTFRNIKQSIHTFTYFVRHNVFRRLLENENSQVMQIMKQLILKSETIYKS